MTGERFPQDLTTSAINRSIVLLADDGTKPGNITIANVLGQILPADITGLATVAKTGSYLDLTNRPNVGAGGITSGTIDNTTIGATTPAGGAFTTLSATGDLSGLVTSTGSNTARSLANRFTDVVNVLDWLTAGQPDGTTDNTAQLQAAITAAAGKARIYFPRTTNKYVITGLTVPANSHLTIDGYIMQKPGVNTATLFNITAAAVNVAIDGTGTLDGNRDNATAHAGAAGIQSLNSSNLYIAGLTITNCYNWPINLTGTWNNGLVEHLTMTNSGNSCEFNGATNAWARNLIISGINDYGWSFYGGCHNCGIEGSTVSSCTADGISILNDTAQPAFSSNIIITNNVCFNNVASGVGVRTNSVTGSNTGIIISGNHLYKNSQTAASSGFGGVLLQNTTYANVTDNIIHEDGLLAGSANTIGIWVSSSTSSYISIKGNTIYNEGQGGVSGFGITNNGSYVTCTDNKIFDNQTTKTMNCCLNGTIGLGCVYLDNDISPTIASANSISLNYDTVYRGKQANATLMKTPSLGSNAPVNLVLSAGVLLGDTILNMTSTTGLAVGMIMTVAGGVGGISQDTFVKAFDATTVTLSRGATSTITSGTTIRFATIVMSGVFESSNVNISNVRVSEQRNSAGNDHNSASTRIQYKLDETYGGWLEFNSGGVTGALALGTGSIWGGFTGLSINAFGVLSLTNAVVIAPRIITTTGQGTVTATDNIIVCNKGTGSATPITLPTSPTTGRVITIKDGKGDANTNNITITPAAGNIDASATAVINTAYGVWRGIYNGTIWNTI